jgi:hypothetical protein
MAARKFEQFPPFLKPSMQSFHLAPAVKFGPLMSDGRQQRAQSAGPHWIASNSYFLTTEDELREFRSYVTKMAGGATEFIMPAHDRRQAPWPSGYDWTTAKPPVTWSGGRVWSVAWKRQIIKVRAYSAAPAGSATLEILQVDAGTIKRGHYFSIIDDSGRARLYQIDDVPRKGGNGLAFTIYFQPSLRAAADTHTILDFDDPMCTMTLDRPDSGIVNIEGYYQSRSELTLRESFGGF